jgi:phage repressor protein C with HTH and peptisase S24 domain
MNSINSRIKSLIDALGVSQNAFAKALNTSGSRVSNITSERNKPDSDILTEILGVYRNVNPDWLLLGEGEIFRTMNISGAKNKDVQPIRTTNSTSNSKSKVLDVHRLEEPSGKYIVSSQNDLTAVPLLDIAAAANSTSGFLAPDRPETIDHLMLPASMIKRGRQNYAFRVVNDSMEPTLYVDDVIIVTHIEPGNYDQLREDRVCVLVTKNKGVIVKRIRNRLKENNLVRCRSDNKFYHSFNVYSDDLLNIFEVRCKISFNLPNVTAGLQAQINKLEDRIEDIHELLKRKP